MCFVKLTVDLTKRKCLLKSQEAINLSKDIAGRASRRRDKSGSTAGRQGWSYCVWQQVMPQRHCAASSAFPHTFWTHLWVQAQREINEQSLSFQHFLRRENLYGSWLPVYWRVKRRHNRPMTCAGWLFIEWYLCNFEFSNLRGSNRCVNNGGKDALLSRDF